MKNEDDNKKIYFLVDTSDVINEILNKYNLKESPEELHEKISVRNAKTNSGFVLDIAREAAKNKSYNISEKLVERLSASKEIADKITEDIKNKLLAFVSDKPPAPVIEIPAVNEADLKNLEKTEEQEKEEEKNTEFMSKLKTPIGVTVKPQIVNDEAILNKPEAAENRFEEKKEKFEEIKKIEEVIEKPKKTVKKQSDSYREPVE